MTTRIKLGPLPKHPGRVPLIFRHPYFYLALAINLAAIVMNLQAAREADTDTTLFICCACAAAMAINLHRLYRDMLESVYEHWLLIRAWEALREVHEQIEKDLNDETT